MRVLYVEDKVDFAKDFCAIVNRKLPKISVDVAYCFDDAERILSNETYDVLLLDLAIPRSVNSPSHIQVGVDLYRQVEVNFSGMPVIIFTGQSDERATDDLRDAPGIRNFFGGRNRPALSAKRKDRLEKVLEILEELSQERASALSVPLSDLNNRALDDDYPDGDRSLLRAFCLFRHGARGRVRKLSGGLSGASVYRLDVLDDESNIMQRCVAKIGLRDEISVEVNNYHEWVTRLPHGYPVHVSCDVVVGGNKRAVFYTLAEGFDRDLFDFFESPNELLSLVRERLSTWHENRRSKRITLRNIILQIGGDGALQRVLDLNLHDLKGVLDVEIACSESTQHGDLHGSNILCRADGSDLCLIDFGDIKVGDCLTDIVTLELSPFFHPSGRNIQVLGRLRGLGSEWFNDAIFEEFVPELSWFTSLRRWAREVAVSHLELAAVVIGYAARQLKYDDTDHDFAISLITAGISELMNT